MTGFSFTASSFTKPNLCPQSDNQSWGFPQQVPHGHTHQGSGGCVSGPRLLQHALTCPEFLTPGVISPRAISGSDAFFFFCITPGNKGGVTFLSMLSSGYVPLSPHDANFHPYKDIFCRAVFFWCNFGDKQMAIGLWRCYWIVTAGNKVPAEKSTVWLPYSKLSYQLWQLRKRNEYISVRW